MKGTQFLIPPEYLGKHLSLTLSHAGNDTPGLHCGNDDCRATLTHPEPAGRRLGHLSAYLIHAYNVSLDKLLPKDAHDVSVALARKLYCGTEVFHDENSNTKLINSSHNG